MAQWHRVRVPGDERPGVFVTRFQEAAAQIATLGLFAYGQSVWRRLDGNARDRCDAELFLAPGTFDLFPAFLAGARVEQCEQPVQEHLELLAGDERNCRQWWG